MAVSLIDHQLAHRLQTHGRKPNERTQKAGGFQFPSPEQVDPFHNNLQAWLEEVGLDRNPFGYIDAGKDPSIPHYLVDHNQFEKVNSDHPSLVFAPAGGGKTAFRVRLARECRAGGHGRRVFPIVYKPTGPGTGGAGIHIQQSDLLRYAARELFLQLAYYPYALDEVISEVRDMLLRAIAWDLDFPLSYYLDWMISSGSLEPVINSFDPTARSLPNPPGRDDIRYLCVKLDKYYPDIDKPGLEARINIMFDLILKQLNFEAIYILVDGVDAFFETANNPGHALRSVSWLLENTLPWVEKHIYVKYFLPDEMQPFIMKNPGYRPLTSKSNIIIIRWDADSLSEVIRRRLQEASGGKFDSLSAVSDRALRAMGRSPEDVLIAELRRYSKSSPRSLIRAVNRLLENHVRAGQDHDKLSPHELTAVRAWIRNEYSAKE